VVAIWWAAQGPQKQRWAGKGAGSLRMRERLRSPDSRAGGANQSRPLRSLEAAHRNT